MTTTRNMPFPFPTFAGRQYVDTQATCPGCDAFITVVLDERGVSADYSECGGMGEGGCSQWIDGDQFAMDVHTATIQSVNGLLESRARGTVGCVCEVLSQYSLIVQPVGDCMFHGDANEAWRMMSAELPEGESWANGI